MRLTLKLIAAITTVILVVLAINASVRIRREASLFERDIYRDNRRLARTLAVMVERISRTAGDAYAIDLVTDADARTTQVDIRWHWLSRASHLPASTREALASGDETVVMLARSGDRDRYHSTLVPVSLSDGRRAAVEVSESLEAGRLYLRETVVHAVITTGVLVLLCALLATVLGLLFVGRPVRRLVDQARRIGAGDLSPQPVPSSGTEIGDLAREMETMRRRLVAARTDLEAEVSARLQTQAQLRHAERLSTVGKLAAGVAHELGTPLNVITGHAELIVEEYPGDSVAVEHSRIIAEQAGRVIKIIRQLLDFARQRSLEIRTHDVVAICRQVVTMLESMAHKNQISLAMEATVSEIEAEVDAVQIQQVVTNLVVNGIQATDPGGAVHLRVELDRAGRQVIIVVRDTGSGIDESLRQQIFEPFVTTKEIGEGTGLGLSVAYGIVQEHHGSIEVKSEPGRGSEFTLCLPIARP